MNKVFKSGISLIIWIPVALMLISTLVFNCIKFVENGHWQPILISGFAITFVASVFFTTNYTVMYDGRLLIRCGIFKWSIDTQSIRKIESSNSLFSAPALSLDRIVIRYGRYDSIVISPKDKAGFVAAIRAINPSVETAL